MSLSSLLWLVSSWAAAQTMLAAPAGLSNRVRISDLIGPNTRERGYCTSKGASPASDEAHHAVIELIRGEGGGWW